MKRTDEIDWRRRARALAWFTIGYNLVEALASGWFGAGDHSLSLLGFGSDSLLEAVSGGVVLWRFSAEAQGAANVAAERRAQRIIGALLLALAATLVGGALWALLHGSGPGSGLAGTAIAFISMAVMAALLRAKLAVAKALDSAVLRADAFCTKSCLWLSGVLLAGSFLILTTRYAWFDALASLSMAALVLREGWENWTGEDGACGCARDQR